MISCRIMLLIRRIYFWPSLGVGRYNRTKDCGVEAMTRKTPREKDK